MMVTAAILAEICSALPLSGSIYIWAAESAGPKYARFFGFVVAWWSCTAWMTFTAGNCQVRYVLAWLDPSSLFFFRQLQIISSLSWRFGKSIFRAELTLEISNGVLLSGLFPKCCFYPPLVSTTYRHDYTPVSSAYPPC